MDFCLTRLTHVHICYTYSLVYTKSYIIKKKKKKQAHHMLKHMYTIK